MADNTTVHPSCAHMEHMIDLFMFQGRPENTDDTREVKVLVNHGYVAGFSPDRLQPLWSGYRVANATRDVDYGRPHLYYDDNRLADGERIGAHTFGTHAGVQYHVGHLTPNEVINKQFGRLAQMETFFMSNMSPQRRSLNTGTWLRLENLIRSIEDAADRDHMWAIAGPIFDGAPDTIARDNGLQVPIPESYFYITVDPFQYPWDDPDHVDVACFRIPQDHPSGQPLTNFEVTQTEIEQAANLRFFPRWPRDVDDVPVARSAPTGPVPPIAAPEVQPAQRHRLLRLMNAER